MAPTRRTHIIRISPDDPPSDTYIDVEVLDAIAFRNENGNEMVLDIKASEAAPYIVDETGGEHSKKPSKGTRRSHMKRLKGENGAMLDVEVIDAMSFTDENGKVWVLDMSGTADDPGIFDTTGGDGGSGPVTRRTHTEIITSPFGGKKSDGSYIKVERCDNIAFRTIMGEEVVLTCPSADDGGKRANTVTTPEGYDPADENSPKPPGNTDGGVYVAFVKNADGSYAPPTIGDTKIQQGPFWWIRKVNTAGNFLEIDWELTVVPANPSTVASFTPTLSGFAGKPAIPITLNNLNTPNGNSGPDIVQKVTDKMMGYYSIWNNISPNVSYIIHHPGTVFGTIYLVWRNDYPYPYEGPPGGSSGFQAQFDNEGDADAYAALINADYPGRIIGYVHASDGQGGFVDLPIRSGGSPPVHVITVPSSDPGIDEQKVRGSVLINLGKMKSADPDAPKNKIVLTFNIPATPSAYEFNFRTYKGKHRDFTTDTKGVPAWDTSDEKDIFVIVGGVSIEGAPNTAKTVTLTLDTKTLLFENPSQPSVGYVKPTT